MLFICYIIFAIINTHNTIIDTINILRIFIWAVSLLRGLTQKLMTFITIVFITLYITPNGHFFIFARIAEA